MSSLECHGRRAFGPPSHGEQRTLLQFVKLPLTEEHAFAIEIIQDLVRVRGLLAEHDAVGPELGVLACGALGVEFGHDLVEDADLFPGDAAGVGVFHEALLVHYCVAAWARPVA